METLSEKPVSNYLMRPRRALGEVCRAAGRDDRGRACATCLLRDLCRPMAEAPQPVQG